MMVLKQREMDLESLLLIDMQSDDLDRLVKDEDK